MTIADNQKETFLLKAGEGDEEARKAINADSDEVAHLYRDDAARDSDLIPPGCEPSSGNGFLALVLGRVNPPFDSKSAAVDVAVGMWTTPLRVVQA